MKEMGVKETKDVMVAVNELALLILSHFKDGIQASDFAEIFAKLTSDDDFKNKDNILQSVPGVGPQTSAMLIANLPELGTLNKQEIAALAGVAPWNNSSGKSDGRMHIWGGRKEVRSILYMSAFTACRFNPVIRSFAERLKQNGKAYKVVITACMRKLLIILNTMIRNQTLWSPKIFQKNT